MDSKWWSGTGIPLAGLAVTLLGAIAAWLAVPSYNWCRFANLQCPTTEPSSKPQSGVAAEPIEVEVVGDKHAPAAGPKSGKPPLYAFSGGAEEDHDGDCVFPKHGGQLVPGSVYLNDSHYVGRVIYDGNPSPSIPNDTPRMSNPVPTHNAGWWVKSETPQKVCIEVFARASCTEAGCGVSAEGRATATERYLVHKP